MNNFQCRICNNIEGNKKYIVKEMMYDLNEEFSYVKCSSCGCLQIVEIPSNISKYYPNNYYSFSYNYNSTNKLKRYFINIRNKFVLKNRSLLGKILTYFYPGIELLIYKNTSFASRILDVGCGKGILVSRLKDLGYKNILGIDPFIEKDIKYSNGSVVEKKSIKDMTGEWDLITYNHSFEHVPEPLTELKYIYSLLSKQGQCIIRIPVADSYAFDKYKENWVQIDAPRHFYLHSKQSMEILANQANLKLINIEYDSNSFQFWGSEQCLNKITLYSEKSYALNPKNSIFSKSDMKLFAKKAKALNLSKEGDSAIIYLTKN
jgi:2-polyprenyl-3-methyl-5-hydroxy-6-metoxy-1,4-benzoquinol methylase